MCLSRYLWRLPHTQLIICRSAWFTFFIIKLSLVIAGSFEVSVNKCCNSIPAHSQSLKISHWGENSYEKWQYVRDARIESRKVTFDSSLTWWMIISLLMFMLMLNIMGHFKSHSEIVSWDSILASYTETKCKSFIFILIWSQCKIFVFEMFIQCICKSWILYFKVRGLRSQYVCWIW